MNYGQIHQARGEQAIPQQEREEYELFRRAIVHREAEAWAAVYARYRLLLISWVRQNSASEVLGESCADIADQAWARAWAALTPARFDNFPTLARLLGYLRTCVATTVIDMLRHKVSAERARFMRESGIEAGPEQDVLAALDRSALWNLALGLLTNEAERVTLIESYAYCLPPRAIQARHPDLFPDVSAVYSAKRNLLTRLQDNCELQQLREEFVVG